MRRLKVFVLLTVSLMLLLACSLGGDKTEAQPVEIPTLAPPPVEEPVEPPPPPPVEEVPTLEVQPTEEQPAVVEEPAPAARAICWF